MRKNRIMPFVLFMAILLGLTFTAQTKLRAASMPVINYSLSTGTVYAGNTFSIYVNVQGVTDLYGASIDTAFDSSVLEIQSIKNVDKTSTFQEVSGLNTLSGLKSYAVLLTGENPGVTGSGKIFEIKAIAKKTGDIVIKTINGTADQLSSTGNNVNINLSDSSAKPITYSVSSYTIKVNEPGKWVKNSNGTWSYIFTSGKKAVGWLQLGTTWYYFDGNGIMKTGWIIYNNKWYYMDSSGAMKTGWVNYANKWYYMDSSGVMKTGWVNDAGKWYYMDSTGVMKTGWIKVGTEWYYLNSNGTMKTGWLLLNGKWYYLYSSGKMAHDTIIDGKYVIGSDGVWKQ